MVCSKKSGDCLIFYCLCNSFWVTAKLLLFSRSGVSDSLQPHGLQHARLPCLSLSPRACSNSCPFSQWCHPTILSYVIPFSSCLQFFPASRYFLMSWLFASGGQSIGASISASVLLMNIQYWLPLGLTGLTLAVQGLSRVFSVPQFQSINSSALSLLYGPPLTWAHDHWKNHSFDYIGPLLTRWCLCFLICCFSIIFHKSVLKYWMV